MMYAERLLNKSALRRLFFLMTIEQTSETELNLYVDTIIIMSPTKSHWDASISHLKLKLT